MGFPEITIEKTVGKRQRRANPKTRRFAATSLGYLLANHLWDVGSTEKTSRPAWIAYAAPAEAARAFAANFRSGRKAAGDGFKPLEIPRSSPHKWAHQSVGEATVTVAYVPELFHLEPITAPQAITFVFMPPLWWIQRQADALERDFGQEASEVAAAALFVAFLDRRTPLPIVSDLGFHQRLYRAALDQDWTRVPGEGAGDSFQAHRLGACGLQLPVACAVDHQSFEAFLTRQTQLHFQEEIRYGQNRIRRPGRLLPFPASPAAQLCLDFAAHDAEPANLAASARS